MTRLVWDKLGDRAFETGVDRGVLYPRGVPGVPWNGLVSVDEDSDGGAVESFYFDGVKYLDMVGAEDFKATIEAFSAPPEFAACDGTKTLIPGLFVGQQRRKLFGLSYRTLIGNDIDGIEHGYKLHIVYNALAAPSGRRNNTVTANADISPRQWSLTTVPVPTDDYKPTAHFVIDSTLVDPQVLLDVESYLYGRALSDPRLPSQTKVLEIMANQITEPITEPI